MGKICVYVSWFPYAIKKINNREETLVPESAIGQIFILNIGIGQEFHNRGTPRIETRFFFQFFLLNHTIDQLDQYQ